MWRFVRTDATKIVAYPSGCWYEDLSDGVMQHYACIAAGQMTVTSLDGATRFEIALLDAEGNGCLLYTSRCV